ncbi:GNAT family N-acetyltransferase [Leifsonia shinshuensis]|uniref:GNAT superfamily N-acetyltransferase n=1 Tax=Leifsonia shinshuensis TaxID=150026 RepID=A0A853CZB2_9MICO|nr:GNAT family N-acetyltransferase [Leifsonia shinshuensis]NYJ23855.1 GNAT superfamily N-acetyltransferase [Leifsonia shinshuensis]
MPTPTERADEYWSAVFRVEPAALRVPGVHTTYVDDPNAGIYVLRIGGTVRVRARAALRGRLDGLVRELPVPAALDAAVWRSALRGTDHLILGPAAHFLTGALIGSSAPEVHPAQDDVRRMAERIPADEVEESGVLEPDVERFGVWSDDGALVAVSALGDWVGGRTDVGLLVAPAARARGFGAQAAAIALHAATRRAGLARWRCREDNAASLRLASRFGLEPYGRNLGIRVAL